MTLTELQTKRDALVSALAGGYRALTVGDKRIEYASADDMQKALAVVDDEIAKLNGTTRLRTTLATHSRG